MELEISNLTLDELHEFESLSKETLLLCQGYQLVDVKSIVQFYQLNEKLINKILYIHPDQAKPGLELKKIYQKYSELVKPHNIPLQNRKDMLSLSSTELMHRENLPEWLMNRCSLNGLHNLNLILKHYRTEKNFLGMRLSGVKMNTILIELCQRYDDLEIESSIDPVENALQSVKKLYESLTATQALALDNFAEIETEKLSSDELRVLQKLQNCGNYKPDLKTLLFFEDELINSIFRIDRLTASELCKLKKRFKELVALNSVQSMDENQYINLLKIGLPESTSLNFDQIALVPGFNSSNGFQVFKTIDYLIENNLILNRRESIIFRNIEKFYKDTHLLSTQEIAHEISKGIPFISMKCSRLISDFDSIFSFLKYVDRSVFNSYKFDEKKNLFVVDDKLVSEINNTEGTHFSKLFIAKIFAIIYSDSYELIGRYRYYDYYIEDESIFFYLVSTGRINNHNTYGYADKIAYKLSHPTIKTFTFSLEDKLKSDMNAGDSPDKDLLDTIAFFLKTSFDLKLNKNYKIRIKKDTEKTIKDALFKIISQEKSWMDIEQISRYMYKSYNYQESEENRNLLIKYLNRNPLLMSRSNVDTGCKEWIYTPNGSGE